MAGKICPTHTDSPPSSGGQTRRVSIHPKESRAYCEGRAAFNRGELKTTNPWDAIDEEMMNLCWSAGWENAAQGTPASETCCAE